MRLFEIFMKSVFCFSIKCNGIKTLVVWFKEMRSRSKYIVKFLVSFVYRTPNCVKNKENYNFDNNLEPKINLLQ